MKKLLGLLLLLINGLLLYAQNDDEIVIRDTRKIYRHEIPFRVIDSVAKRFPDAAGVQYYQTTTAAARNGWTIVSSNVRKEWPKEQLIYYTVAFQRKNFHYYGLFNKNGVLLKYKSEMKKGSAPASVKQAVGRLSFTFPGYAVSGKNCFRVVHVDSGNEYYEVTIDKNGEDAKRLYYSRNGQLLKVKE